MAQARNFLGKLFRRDKATLRLGCSKRVQKLAMTNPENLWYIGLTNEQKF
jgi:hypothetical protein